MTEKEQIQNQIQELQEKLKKLEELSQTKSPVEEAFKDWWGQYPETGFWDGFDEKRWQGFQAGYEFAYAISTAKEVMEKVQKEQEVEPSMTNCVITGNPPDGYVTWKEWYNELGSKGILHKLRISSIEQEVREWDVVHESVKWCEDHPDWDLFDYLKPQTPEQVADGLKEAFREAVKQGVVSSADKPPTLRDVCMEWWWIEDGDTENCIEDLVSRIEKWLPKEQSAAGSQNAYVESAVEGYNDCIRQIKSRLR